MRKQFLECGKIVTTQGIKGEVRVQPWCDSPDFLLGFDTLYLDGGRSSLEIERSRVQKNVVVFKFKGTETVEEAVTLRGKVLYLDRADVPMEEGEYFVQDLIGCTVRRGYRAGLRENLRCTPDRGERCLLSERCGGG